MSSIYKLVFPNDERIYVGQTTGELNIRLSRHIKDLEKGTRHSNALITAFPKCGVPTIVLIEECLTSQLDDREIYYIKKYNSYHKGFNGTLGGKGVGKGENHPRALYTNEDYACAVHFLAYTNYTYSEIEAEIGVNKSVLINIQGGATAAFIGEEYPIEYAIMRSNKRKSGRVGRKEYPNVISPEGVVHSVTDGITKFAKVHNIDSNHLGEVLRGTRPVVQGWKLHKDTVC